MREITYVNVKDGLIDGTVRVLEYPCVDNNRVNDVTSKVIAINDITERVGSICVELLIKRDGYLEKMMANPVFTGHGLTLFCEDTLGKIELEGFTMI